ncbi:MAG: hypothetical protein JOZ41_00695 [Chloroflexi bacterium]|nr:hypothetical protein [Chloroflexota bacterium]
MDSYLAQRRPMTVGEILDRAFRLYLDNAGLFLGTVAVLLVPQAILDAIYVPLSILSIFTGTYSLGVLILVVAARDMDRQITIREGYAALGLGTWLLLVVANIIVGISVAIGFVLLVIPGIFLLVRLAFVSPAIVLERQGIGGALSRSWELVAGSWWRAFGIGLLVFVIAGVGEGLLGAILGRSVSPQVAQVVGVLVGMLFQPFTTGALVLMYYDLRIRKEGSPGEPVGYGPVGAERRW